MHGLSARAGIRGKRATKNIRKCIFPEVLFGLFPIVKGLGRPDSSTTELYDDVNA